MLVVLQRQTHPADLDIAAGTGEEQLEGDIHNPILVIEYVVVG
jgi:hypothetical protein